MVTVAAETGSELKKVIATVSRDKNLDKAVIVDALEQAVLHAARRDLGLTADLEAHYNEEIDEIELFQFRTIVHDDDIADSALEIGETDATKLDPNATLGDSIGIKVDTSRFGRIAAQSAKQIIVQKVRDAERAQIHEEFKDRKGEILSGHVRRFERNDIIVDLGRTEAIIPQSEQIPTEKFKIKDRITGYVIDVKRSSRGPQIIMSRAHAGFLMRLFEQHVSEIYDGIVTIESAARDPGLRSKIAVHSRDSSVDPVGACVGMKGARVQAVVSELNGEKIDIIPWDSDPARLVCNALAPATVSKVIVDEQSQSMEVIVPEEQLSLAIGKRGQNVRLAAQLTGWKLDIKSEAKVLQEALEKKDQIAKIPGIGMLSAGILVNEGIRTAADVAALNPRTLVRLLNAEETDAEKIIAAARQMVIEGGSTFAPTDTAMAAPTAARTTTSADEERQGRIRLFLQLGGVGEAAAHSLADAGYTTIGDIVADSTEEVASRTGLSVGIARTVQLAAERYLEAEFDRGE